MKKFSTLGLILSFTLVAAQNNDSDLTVDSSDSNIVNAAQAGSSNYVKIKATNSSDQNFLYVGQSGNGNKSKLKINQTLIKTLYSLDRRN